MKLSLTTLFIAVFSLFLSTGIIAENPDLFALNLAGSVETTSPNQEVCVKITAQGFKNIVTAQWSHKWDPAVLQFKEIRNFNLPQASGGDLNFATNRISEGILTFSWNTTDFANGTTLNDNSVLYEICFTAIGQNGKFSLVEFSNSPRAIEISDLNGIITPNLTSGRVNIGQSTGGDGFTINIGEASTSMGEEICIPVTVTGWKNLTSVQHSINWNPQQLEFVDIKNFALTTNFNLTFGLTETNLGKIRFLWISNDPVAGDNVADNTVIYELCFKATGDCETTVPVSITGDPAEIAATNSAGDIPLNADNGSVTIGSCQFSVVAAAVLNPCPGQTNGSINITVFGKDANTTYAWSNGATTEDLTNLAPGNYQVTVTNGQGQKVSLDSPVALNDNGMQLTPNIVDPQTSSSSDGRIELTVTGGSAPYEYLWSNNSTGKDLVNIPEGSYSVTVTDANSCTSTATFAVSLGIKVANATVNSIKCNGDNNGSIDITVSGGGGTYTYKWSNGATTEDINGLAAGSYSVTVTDGASNTTTGGPYSVTEPSAITVTSQVTDVANQNDGAVSLTVSGGATPYTYAWSNGATTKDISNLEPNNYTVTITDANQCSSVETIPVQTAMLRVNILTQSPACFGSTNGSATATVSNGASPYTYKWNNGATAATISGVGAGTYTVTITDATGATASASGELTEPTSLSVKTNTEPANGGSQGSATVIAQGGTPPYTYNWSPSGQTTQTISNLVKGRYTVVVTDANGCSKIATANVRDNNDIECYDGRKVITPNADGLNDNLIIECVEDTPTKLRIFTSHGQLVYEQDNYDNTWEGTDNGGTPLSDGVYMWVLDVRLDPNDTRIYTGSVTILRKLN